MESDITWIEQKSNQTKNEKFRKDKKRAAAVVPGAGSEVYTRRIRIRVLYAYAALRYTADDGTRYLMLRLNEETHQFELFGGACPFNWTLQETLMKHLRDQLCLRFNLETLERYLIAALQKRNFARLVGGGTLYSPVISAQGFQSYIAYVVIDVPSGNVLPLMSRSSGSLRPFDGKFALANMTAPHRDLLSSLLRMRMQVFRPECAALPDTETDRRPPGFPAPLKQY